MRAENFQRWTPYIPDPDPTKKASGEPKKADEYDRAKRAADKGKAPASETMGRTIAPRRPDALRIQEVSYVHYAS